MVVRAPAVDRPLAGERPPVLLERERPDRLAPYSPGDYSLPFLRAAGNINAQTNGTTPATPTLPQNRLNDILIISAYCHNSNQNFAVPDGYTELAQLTAGADRVAFFWKRSTGSESNPSITNAGWTSTNLLAAKVDCFRGCKTTGSPFEALDSISSGSSPLDSVELTTAGLKRLAVHLWARNTSTASTPDVLWTEGADLGTGGGGGCRFYVDYSNMVWPGTIPATVRSGASTVAYGAIGFALIGDGPTFEPTAKNSRTGLWVWDFLSSVVNDPDEVNILLNECVASSITDLYCYSFASELATDYDAVSSFIAKCTRLGIRVWGLDGAREYLADLDGAQQLYDDVAAIVAYNASVTADKRFYGFHMDVEPADLGAGLAFHNGIASSALSTTPGSGAWQSTEKLDREFLLRDWVQIHEDVRELCHDAGLFFGTALPTFVDDYFGEPLACSVDGVRQNVFLHLRERADVIALMSYNTTPGTVIDRIRYEFRNGRFKNAFPELGFSAETVTGVGSGISYGDTTGKQTKLAMFTDRATVDTFFSGNPKYLWFNIHDWSGYKALAPASEDTSDPFI
jgi:hypothetical protein